jgi:hypothetical protein
LKITSPTIGQNIKKGEVVTISWQGKNMQPNIKYGVALHLRSGAEGNYVKQIANSLPPSGSYEWHVDADIGKEYQISSLSYPSH